MHRRRATLAATSLASALFAGACSGDEEPLLSGEQPEADEVSE